MPERSPETEAILKKAAELDAKDEKAAKARGPDLMEEEVPQGTMRARYMAMSPPEREAMLKQRGRRWVADMLRKKS